MTNQERILSNNALIDQAIAKANSLPNAGSGSSLPSASKKEVNFYDYDGTILYSYTVEEAQALTSLPILPSHAGLICQGWNWTLDDIKSHNRAVDVGAMYITDDGKTRIYIRLEEGRTSPMLGCCPHGTVTVDWGDGTATETLTGTSINVIKWTSNHNYANAGDYVITLTANGDMGFKGNSTNNQYSGVLRYSSGANSRNRVYQNAIQKIEIGNRITHINNYAFYNCHSLASITIPNSVRIIAENAFSNCYSLASITIPNSIATLSVDTFNNCHSLASITIPNSVTIINNCAFYNCHSLASITIPNSVTIINNYTFNNCYGMAIYDFTSHISVPTLFDTNAFTGISSDCVIKVPASLYDEWIAATNWSTYASYISVVGVNDNNGNDDNGGSGEIISFIIEGKTCQAEEGMTWAQWCNSSYNTKGLQCRGSGVYDSDLMFAVCKESEGFNRPVSPEDIIERNMNYAYALA